MLDALLDTLSQPSPHSKARVCVAVPRITFDLIGKTYSVDLGDRRGEGKNSKSEIETSVGTRARKTMGDLTREAWRRISARETMCTP